MTKIQEIKTIKEYGRGIIGGLLFSLPLLYTMELWWIGFLASPEKLLAFIGVTFILLLGYNRYAGMREDSSYLEVFRESVEEIGIAFVVTFLFLLLINKINFQMSFDEMIGKVIVESMIVAIGISVGTAQLGQEDEGDTGMDKEDKEDKESDKKQDPLQLWILSFCGAALFSSSVAPTEEILQIAVVSENIHLLLMVLTSLLLSFVILYYSDFKNSKAAKGGLREISLHIMIAYSAALFISVIFLWFFGRTGSSFNSSFNILLAQVIVLSIPGLIGASAGRLLIK